MASRHSVCLGASLTWNRKNKSVWIGLTCFSIRLSSWQRFAAFAAPSIWARRPALLSRVAATWFSRVTTRLMILWKKGKYASVLLLRSKSCVRSSLCSYWQPEEEGEAWDVEVPLGSEQLHVHVVVHVGVHFGILHGLRMRVLLDFTQSI